MLVERLLFSETLAAVLTAKSVGSLVDELVTLQPCAGDEGLPAALSLTDVFAIICVYGFDVLL